MPRPHLTAPLLALALALPPSVLGQDPVEEPRPPQFHLGIQGVYGKPVGEFGDHVEQGWGVNFGGILAFVPGGALGIQGEGGFLVYGSEERRVCFSATVGCRVELDLTTTNSIAYGSIGPQLMAPRGRVRPYANASVGFSYFSTRSELEGTSDNEPFAETTNFDDFIFAWGSGAGLLIGLSSGRTPVYLDLGARYHGNGEAEYLKEGDIQDNEDGTISFTPTRSETNLITYRIGVMIGVRPGQQQR
jgi:hypothetical protein